jgi:hypothetical protein
MKIPSFFSKLLTNKYLLYAVVFITLLNMFGYLIARDFQSIVLYILFYFIIRYFSRNMTIVLFVSLVLVNFLAMKHIRLFEGNATMAMTNAKKDDKTTTKPEPQPHEEHKTVNGKKDAKDSIGQTAALANAPPSMSPEELMKHQEQLKQIVDGMHPIIEKMEPMMKMADKLSGFLGKSNPQQQTQTQFSH